MHIKDFYSHTKSLIWLILENSVQPIVTIGIPAFNSARNISKAINSVLNQTFKNFELIISDNASTDSTSSICMEYAKKDHRIKYIKQKKNIYLWPNYNFLIKNAKTKYFVWLASDDYWEPTFLEKNIKILESNQNLVGSIGEIDFYGEYAYLYQKDGKFVRHTTVKPFSGDYLEKVKLLFKSPCSMMYGVYRTKEFQKSLPKTQNWLHEYEFLLPLLKCGDFHVIDDILMYRGTDGVSSSNLFRTMRSWGHSITEIIFMSWPVFKWSLNNLGLKFMLKNFHLYVRLVYTCNGRMIRDLIRPIKKKST